MNRAKVLLIGLVIFFATSVFGYTLELKDKQYIAKVVDAIYWAEGGKKASHPYGVMIPKLSHDQARQKCLAIVEKKYIEWKKSGKNVKFLPFLQQTYCPTTGKLTSKERELNKYWLKNVSWFVEHPKPVK